MLPNPIGERFFWNTAIGNGQNFGNYLGISGREVVAIYSEKCDHGQEPYAFVAIAVRVVLHEPTRVGRGEHWHVSAIHVVPLLLRSYQS